MFKPSDTTAAAAAASPAATSFLRITRRPLPSRERRLCIEVILGRAMEVGFGLIDATGSWDWKIASDVCEAATALSVRKYGSVIRAKPGSPISMLLSKITGFRTVRARRRKDSQALEPLLMRRQVGGISIDDWTMRQLRGVWINKSDKLTEDARPEWSVLDVERLLITRLRRFCPSSPIRIRLAYGVLFTTYATLRADRRGKKLSCVRLIMEWSGSGFDGVIGFDEPYAIRNASPNLTAMTADARNTPGRSMFVRLTASPEGPAGKWVAPRVMLRIWAWVLSHGRLAASTQHNVNAREVR
ncbi:strawberry notch-like NTP hydrolase domain-containing protein [Bradyrhizobium sp. DASA03076]|uniref:strawberry notch-like NTP hydrolase domain-containing protein n=1 Tax=Bradyrhizobium sp. BLXBL-03 TaxID=3395916 RepID=UPI003F71A7E1